jgi:type I restriction enzyme M protein
VLSEVEALTLALVGRIQELGQRYAETVSYLNTEVEELEAKVFEHFAAMGV